MSRKLASIQASANERASEQDRETKEIFRAFEDFLVQQASLDSNNLHGSLLLRRLDDALLHAPNNPDFWRAKALVLERTNRFDEALTSISKAIGVAALDQNTSSDALRELPLIRSRIFTRLNRLTEAGRDNCEARGIPQRVSGTASNLIDLSPFYNAALTDSLQAWKENDLAELQSGVQILAGSSFDVRGVVELNSSEVRKRTRGKSYPISVAGIPIQQRVRQFHFLHGAGIKQPAGKNVGAYILHYADGQTQELPIVYGEDLRDWWNDWPGVDDKETPRAVIAWTGTNAGVRTKKGSLRLYKCSRENPRPTVEIVSLDFISTMTGCAPFLVALTVE